MNGTGNKPAVHPTGRQAYGSRAAFCSNSEMKMPPGPRNVIKASKVTRVKAATDRVSDVMQREQ
jgi:hypothetical protein